MEACFHHGKNEIKLNKKNVILSQNSDFFLYIPIYTFYVR